MDYESLLASVGPDDWFPVLVFRRRDYADDDTDLGADEDGAATAEDGEAAADSAAEDDDDTAASAVESDDEDSAVEGATLFRADSGCEAWRQVLTAWLPPGSEVWDPCCGSGDVVVGAAAAGMRIVGADADAANVAATRAALKAAAGVAPARAVDPDDVTR